MPRAKGGSIPPPRVMVPPGHGGLISTLNPNDVLSGRGGRINNHPGNITFRTVVEDYKHEYLDPRTRKLEKAHVAARLVVQIRSTNPPGRFLREDANNPGMYVEIGDQKAWKKAGQALREDAPDVRKEIDEETGEAKKVPALTPQQKKPPQPILSAGYHHQQQQRPHGVPPGIPPSVSYSPTSQPMPLAPPRRGVDPPEAPGVSGYRQPPLRYAGSGRGGRGQPGPYSGRGGRGPPPQHHPQHPQGQPQHPRQQPHPQQQQYAAHPPQGYHPQPAYYGHPQQPGQHYPLGPPPGQFQQHPPQQFQHHPPHHPHPFPPHGQQNGAPPPQFSAPQPQDKRKKSIDVVTAGVHKAMDEVTGFANKVIHGKPQMQSRAPPPTNGRGPDFPLTTSVGTDFTMSEISSFGDSRGQFADSPRDASMKEPARGSTQPMPPHKEERAVGGGSGGGGVHQGGSHKQSTSSSSGKESFTVSDLLGSNQTLGTFNFGHSGRTRSFPDLMLSTGDLLPPLHSGDSDREDCLNMSMLQEDDGDVKDQRTSSGRVLRRSFHRHSSSESSNHSMTSLTLKGFHPVRGRSNTNISGINDAMSIMSLDSRRSMKSETSSWLDNFRSMQSIHSDTLGDSLKGSLPLRDDDGGSVRSFLSDVSNDLNALDLAEPLLPPMYADHGLNDSVGDFLMARPDP